MSKTTNWLGTPRFTPMQVIGLGASFIFTVYMLTDIFQNLSNIWKVSVVIAWAMALLLAGIPMGKVKAMVNSAFNIFLDPLTSDNMKLKMLFPPLLVLSQIVGAIFENQEEENPKQPEKDKPPEETKPEEPT